MCRHADDLEGKSILVSILTVRSAGGAFLKIKILFILCHSGDAATSLCHLHNSVSRFCQSGTHGQKRGKSRTSLIQISCVLACDWLTGHNLI